MTDNILHLRVPRSTVGLCFQVDDQNRCQFKANGSIRTVDSARFDGWVGLVFSEPVSPGTAIELEIACSTGDKRPTADVRIGQTAWLPVDADLDLSPACDQVPTALMDQMRALVARRRAALQGIRYFRALDACTNAMFSIPANPHTPDSFEHRARTLARDVWSFMPQLADVLFERIHERRSAAPKSVACSQLPVFDCDRVEQVSSLILLLINHYFGGANTAEQLDAIGQAHDMFAWGELKQATNPKFPIPEAAPDSAAVILYSEFAQMAIQLDIHAEQWYRLLPILTRMADLYVYSYESGPQGWNGAQAFGKYVGVPAIVAPRQVLADRSHLLRAKYRTLNRDELGAELGELARRAFTDEWPFHARKSQAA